MTVGVPALAAGFASQFDTIGPYVGFGSLIAVIAMAVLVFSQGRELQRLRDLAGTAPERLQALEERLEREQRLLTGPARPAAPGVATPGKLAPHPGAPVPAPAAAAAATGAAAAGSGAPPAPPVPGVAPPLAAGAAAAAAATRPPVAGAPTAANPARPVPPGAAGTSQATRAVPAVAGTPRASTPVGRANAAARQREPEPPKRSVLQVIGVGLVAAVVLVGVLFALGVIGGDTESPVADRNKQDQPKSQPDSKPTSKTYSPKQTSVVVLNATGKGGLAKTGSDLLDNRRFATGAPADYSENGVPVFKPTSIVAYRNGYGNRDAAKDIAKYLGLKSSTVKAMDDNVKASVDGTPKVIVILGQDYAAKTGTTPADSNPTGTTPGGTTTGTTTDPSSGGTPGATGSTGNGTTTPDSSITGDVSGDINGDVVADTTVGTP